MTTIKGSIDSVASPKLPMILEGRNVVRPGGFNGGIELPNIDTLLVDGYVGSVRTTSFFRPYGNASESGSAIRLNPSIHSVLGFSRLPEIFFAAIKTVSIFVVNMLAWESHDKTMERNGFLISSALSALGYCGRRIKIASVYFKTPFEVAAHFRVLVVDQCRLALGQRNLNHFVSPSLHYKSVPI